MSSIESSRSKKARNMQTGLLLVAHDRLMTQERTPHDTLSLEVNVLDGMIAKVAFMTLPRKGNGPDLCDIVVGRNVYYALTVMEEFQKHIAVYPELSVKCGTTIFYKGIPVTTDAMFKPGMWMLPPNSLTCIMSRQNGSTLIRRPLSKEMEIPVLDQVDGLPYIPMTW
jgi:hypothetical protein